MIEVIEERLQIKPVVFIYVSFGNMARKSIVVK